MPSNVILITIDALRADHVGCLGYFKATTPSIDNVANDAVVFTNAISNGPYTSTSFPSIFTSIISLVYSGGENYLPSRKSDTIAEIIRKDGYSTAGFHSNPFLASYFGYDRGFSHFEDLNAKQQLDRDSGGKAHVHLQNVLVKIRDKISTNLNALGARHTQLRKLVRTLDLLSIYGAFTIGHSYYASGATINEKALSWLKNNPNRSFLWVHYMDLHPPYILNREYRNRCCSQTISSHKGASVLFKMREKPEAVSKKEVNLLINLYDAQLCYVDRCVGNSLKH